MVRPIRVIQYGLGAMGAVMARMILEKADLKLVGAIVHHAEDSGKDVGAVLGLKKHIGIGMTPKAFKQGVAAGKLPLHIGMPECVHEVADTLGWKIDRIRETRDPVVSERNVRVPGYKTVARGEVVGFEHRCFAIVKGNVKILLEELGNVDPKLNYRNTIEIDGYPRLLETMNVPMGNLTTTSHAVNVLPAVVAARPGLLSMVDLPVIACLPNKRSSSPFLP